MAIRLPKPSGLVSMAILATAGLIALAAYARFEFGSIPAGLAYLQGDRLLVDGSEYSFGVMPSQGLRELMIPIQNCADSPVTIIGAQVSCTCIQAVNLPLVLSPKASGTLVIKVAPGGKTGPIQETMHLFADKFSHQLPTLRISGVAEGSGGSVAVTNSRG